MELNQIFNPRVDTKKNRVLAQDYLDFVYNADLLIADGQYTEEEYQSKVGWGHSSIQLLFDISYQAHVKQLAIFHHDPQHSDKFLDELWMKSRSEFPSDYKKMDVFWAREGMTLAI